MARENPLRDLPSVDRLLADDSIAPLAAQHGRQLVVTAIRTRSRTRARMHGPEAISETWFIVFLTELEALEVPRLRRSLNATGVIVHTNLGRAPLAEAALERVQRSGAATRTSSTTLTAGARGSRQDHLAPRYAS